MLMEYRKRRTELAQHVAGGHEARLVILTRCSFAACPMDFSVLPPIFRVLATKGRSTKAAPAGGDEAIRLRLLTELERQQW